MYLQPIFESPDIAKQLIKESKNFKAIDNYWRSTINKSRDLQNVLRIINSIDNLYEDITKNNNTLDVIQKQLSTYLENKRAKFARFYFLSNN